MKEQIHWSLNRMPKSEDRQLSVMSLDNVAQAHAFHKSFPQYAVTPLARLDGLREALDLGPDSRVLMFSTEGNTDPEKYEKIVWGGEYAEV